jgi:hypothetical protein
MEYVVISINLRMEQPYRLSPRRDGKRTSCAIADLIDSIDAGRHQINLEWGK